MAIVQYGALVTGIRGKVGGQVFQRCGQSASLRNKSTVVSSQSSYASGTRSEFSSLASTWRSMSLEQKTSFNTWASSYPTFDRYGTSIILSAYQLFMYINRPLLMAGLPLVLTCVQYVAPPVFDCFVSYFYVPDEEFLIELDGELAGPYQILFYMSAEFVPPGLVSSPKTVYMGRMTIPDGGSINVYDAYVARYPNSVFTDMNFYIEYWSINTESGAMILSGKESIPFGV